MADENDRQPRDQTAEEIVLSLQRAASAMPEPLQAAVAGEAPSVIVESAESVTTFAGFEADSEEMRRVQKRIEAAGSDPTPHPPN
jgi:hypothetical protein